MIQGVRAAKRAPPWQDLRAMHSQKAICGAFRIHDAHILPKPARFGCMARESCQGGALFPSQAPFGIHRAQKLPRIAARERIARAYCHCRMPGNAFREHFAIGERPQRHSAMYRNVMHRSATDARAERPVPRLPLGQRRRTLPLMPHVPDSHSPAPPAAALRRHAPHAALSPPLKK